MSTPNCSCQDEVDRMQDELEQLMVEHHSVLADLDALRSDLDLAQSYLDGARAELAEWHDLFKCTTAPQAGRVLQRLQWGAGAAILFGAYSACRKALGEIAEAKLGSSALRQIAQQVIDAVSPTPAVIAGTIDPRRVEVRILCSVPRCRNDARYRRLPQGGAPEWCSLHDLEFGDPGTSSARRV